MLTILKMNPIGNKSEQPIVYFEFGFDNTIELPKLAFQIGEDISIVANNSIAVNNKTNIVYKFNGDSWIRTNDKYNSSNNSNITTNGNYSIANNSIGGFNGVNVDVEPTGLIEKEITENGTYLPASDEATAYSKVVVDVPPGFNTWKMGYDTIIVHSNDGIYDVSPFTYGTIILSEPVVKIIKMDWNPMTTATIKFTPAENYDNIYRDDGNTVETYTGDSITNGDGKIYYFHRDLGSGHTIEKRNGDFTITIT